METTKSQNEAALDSSGCYIAYIQPQGIQSMRYLLLTLIILLASKLQAQELSLSNAERPTANSKEEGFAAEFSLDRAAQFLDQAALNWTHDRKCFTCHTNYLYLQARPLIGSDVKAHQQVREALEGLVNVRWESKGPRWDSEVVMSAAVLAMNDLMTTNTLDAATHKALDRMWKVQRDDGGFDWLKCNWPPMEVDDDYAIAIAALAAGAAPENYKESDQAKQGIMKLQQYLRANPPPTLHHSAMLIWAESYGISLLTAKQRTDALTRILELQLEDGGWAAASLGDWKRTDKQAQVLDESDAYGTAFVVYILSRSGMTISDSEVQEGIAWLKKNQRQSGRWYARSLTKDSKHFLSHAATAFAVMAIQSCNPPSQD